MWFRLSSLTLNLVRLESLTYFLAGVIRRRGWKSSPAEIQWWFPEEESIPEPVVPIPLSARCPE